MNDTTLRKRERLSMLATFLICLLLANPVGGQESVSLKIDCNFDALTELEPDSHCGHQSDMPNICDPCQVPTSCPAGQLVMTCETLGRRVPVVVCPQDDVWLISARKSHCAPSDLSLLQCSHLENGCWQDSELDELVQLHSTDKTRVTMLYVHGNRTALKWAESRGLQFYDTALRKANRPPMRFVIFAWRSETERARIIPDYEIKSNRSVTIGETFEPI